MYVFYLQINVFNIYAFDGLCLLHSVMFIIQFCTNTSKNRKTLLHRFF